LHLAAAHAPPGTGGAHVCEARSVFSAAHVAGKNDLIWIRACGREWLGGVSMYIQIRAYEPRDLLSAVAIWNQVVDEGLAFPQEEDLTPETGAAFFAEQSFVGVAEDGDTGRIFGLYILHPNNVGRCGHIANASYAVNGETRGQKVGEKLVTHCLETAKKLGFRILQFNAVVATNTRALRLYRKLGFTQLGAIPGGFRQDTGYVDIIPHYIEL